MNSKIIVAYSFDEINNNFYQTETIFSWNLKDDFFKSQISYCE